MKNNHYLQPYFALSKQVSSSYTHRWQLTEHNLNLTRYDASDQSTLASCLKNNSELVRRSNVEGIQGWVLDMRLTVTPV